MTNPMDRGELWSFLRSCLSQGGDIWLDHKETSYEQYSARLDAAARERVPKLMQLLGDEITQLRGNLSLAEEGLANYALEFERLKDRLETQKGVIANHIEGEREIERLRSALRGIMLDEAPLDRSTGVWLREQACEALGKQPNAHEPCEQRLRTPQGEPALTQTDELPGTREPVVTAPQGIAGESPALFQQEDPSRGAGSEPCERAVSRRVGGGTSSGATEPSREQLLQFARTILSGTTNDGLYNGRCPQELWNEFFPMDEPGVVIPEFAAEFERGTMGAILKELGDFVQGRDQPYWAGFEFALEEVKCRLDMAWKALPTEQSEGTRSDEVVRFDANRKIIGCTCPDEVRGKPMPAPDPNCPISFPHAEVAWGKRRRHNDDSPLGAKIRAGEQQ